MVLENFLLARVYILNPLVSDAISTADFHKFFSVSTNNILPRHRYTHSKQEVLHCLRALTAAPRTLNFSILSNVKRRNNKNTTIDL